MAVENSADLLAMLGDFGQTVTVSKDDFDRDLITAIYDEDYVESLDIAGVRPLLHCRSTDVADVIQGDDVEVAGVDYLVAKVQQDGTGVTILILEEQ
ncbi:hypothetical protein HOD41_09325 [bacterium]|nr:hypothetical protein [bacterium]